MVELDCKQWLRDHPDHTAKVIVALYDCMSMAKACSYWEWHRGTRIMWFRLPEEWHLLFRDAPRIFHKGPLPKGFTRNHPSESRAAEIAVQRKLFKLHFRRYTEDGFVDLAQGRYAITKVQLDGEVVDIRVVWNSRSNGYNGKIWL